MPDWLGGALMLACGGALIVAVVVVRWRARKRFGAGIEAIAQRTGLQAFEGRSLHGIRDGRAVMHDGERATASLIPVATERFSVDPKPGEEDEHDVVKVWPTGDAAFDEVFEVTGHPGRALVVLTGAARATLLRVHNEELVDPEDEDWHRMVSVTSGGVWIIHAEAVSDPEEVERDLDLLDEVIAALGPWDQPLEAALHVRAAEEPDPGVRAACEEALGRLRAGRLAVADGGAAGGLSTVDDRHGGLSSGAECD
ncbi:MAG: hypothetical protein ACI9MR_002132 [Myxococcota bacterium]|jgi:hypothetical protein